MKYPNPFIKPMMFNQIKNYTPRKLVIEPTMTNKRELIKKHIEEVIKIQCNMNQEFIVDNLEGLIMLIDKECNTIQDNAFSMIKVAYLTRLFIEVKDNM